MSATNVMDKQRERKNLRTALVLGVLALCSLAAFVYKIWNLG